MNYTVIINRFTVGQTKPGTHTHSRVMLLFLYRRGSMHGIKQSTYLVRTNLEIPTTTVFFFYVIKFKCTCIGVSEIANGWWLDLLRKIN